mmetsp:Transcript_6177/g.9317  ORF Transcript_6177/g.9317 Transcript_6177/m.9317 type:complete len:323 (-) Transcript_6177:132-1100(-)|eukprot:CAMPEP_0185040408 /NCGR_PEP_ID=MMETSP1103-20130426/38438_1 /TAXON_ID=36769 /ORGANISM="Paraphysomonas bandaiensis, Strain Caron Lab Isolate" /LENGTH=322 /DNA_ID=CAMNT_0027579701 /DNA_START=79 /DNA_END=1047 /DNA_ORIENTATION=-
MGSSDEDEGQEEVPSLIDICTSYIALNTAHIKYMCASYLRRASAGVELYRVVDVMRKANFKITVSNMQMLEMVCPELRDDPYIDVVFWRKKVEENYRLRPIFYPYPENVNFMHEMKRRLLIPNLPEVQYLSDLKLISRAAFSAPLMKETGIGVAVNGLSKHSPFPAVAKAATELKTKWKETYKHLSSLSSSNSSVNESSDGSEQTKSAVQCKDIQTWRALFAYCQAEEAEHFAKVAKKLSGNAKKKRDEQLCTLSVSSDSLSENKKRKLLAFSERRSNGKTTSSSGPGYQRRTKGENHEHVSRVFIPTAPLHLQPLQKVSRK